MPDAALSNIALLIDADNSTAREIDAVLTVLAGLGQVNIRRAYGNWAKAGLKGWSGVLHSYGISPHQQFDMTKGKNATDMAMTIDAMDLLYRGKVDGFGIVSSDSDFTPLAMRLRQDGVLVYGFGRANTPDAFKTACTRFIEVDALTDTAGDDDEPRPAKAKIATRKKVDEAVVDVLATAWKASARDERGFASLAEMGKIANNRSSFDARTYGFKRLSDLIEAVGDQFKVERRDNGVFVKRQH